MLAAFGNIDDAAKSVAQIISAGIIPAGLEMMDNPAIAPRKVLSPPVIRQRRKQYSFAK